MYSTIVICEGTALPCTSTVATHFYCSTVMFTGTVAIHFLLVHGVFILYILTSAREDLDPAATASPLYRCAAPLSLHLLSRASGSAHYCKIVGSGRYLRSLQGVSMILLREYLRSLQGERNWQAA
jgi:hypothetical protein